MVSVRSESREPANMPPNKLFRFFSSLRSFSPFSSGLTSSSICVFCTLHRVHRFLQPSMNYCMGNLHLLNVEIQASLFVNFFVVYSLHSTEWGKTCFSDVLLVEDRQSGVHGTPTSSTIHILVSFLVFNSPPHLIDIERPPCSKLMLTSVLFMHLCCASCAFWL